MKRIILIGLMAVMLCSCAESNEKKAEKMAAELVKVNLAYPDSYEAIETTIDSTQVTFNDVKTMVDMVAELGKLIKEFQLCESNESSKKLSMDIDRPVWYDPSPYKYEDYNKSKAEWEAAVERLKNARLKLFSKIGDMKEWSAGEYKNEFLGWIIVHRYWAAYTEGGELKVDDIVLFSDPEFTSCNGYTSRTMQLVYDVFELVKETESEEELIERLRPYSYLI